LVYKLVERAVWDMIIETSDYQCIARRRCIT